MQRKVLLICIFDLFCKGFFFNFNYSQKKVGHIQQLCRGIKKTFSVSESDKMNLRVRDIYHAALFNVYIR